MFILSVFSHVCTLLLGSTPTPPTSPAPQAEPQLFPDIPEPAIITDDTAATLNACALGWALTEVLGRAFVPHSIPPEIAHSGTTPQPPPLANERSPSERQKALMIYIWQIVRKLQLDQLHVPHGEMRGDESQYVDIVKAIIDDMANRKPVPAEDRISALRAELNQRMRWWDAQLQDVLPTISQRVYAGYQAARGLADLAWICVALEDEGDRKRLLDPKRIDLVSRLILSLAPAFGGPFTAPALMAGFTSWSAVLANKQDYNATDIDAKMANQLGQSRCGG